jgi:hypothetical protein
MATCTSEGYYWNSRGGACTNNYASTGTYDGNDECLRCHSTAGGYARNVKESYLMTGHRNMLREVTAGVALGNAEWTADNSGSPYPGIDWVNANVDDGSPAGTLLGIYGGWYRNAVESRIGHTPRATETVRDIEVGDGSYCGAYCHATGPNAFDAPANFFGSPVPGTSFVGTGVQCTRCHDHSADGVASDTDWYDPLGVEAGPSRHHDTTPEGKVVTWLCYECHEQSGVAPYEVHTSPSSFIGHYRTNQFLNSPHARFSGSDHDQIADSGLYDTHFEEGCTGCHDVHVGSVDPSNTDQTHIVNRCGIECHAPQTACPPWNPGCSFVNYDGYAGFHDGWGDPAPDTTTAAGITPTNPTGAGTNPDGCVSCHMGPGTNHLFLNSVDADYDPFSADPCPPEAFWTAETGYDSCAQGLDQACGQCHYSGGIAMNKFLRSELAVFAFNYHNDPELHDGDFAAANDFSAYGARFNWYQGAACNEICTDATDNDSSSFSWDWGGTGSGDMTGAIACYIYDAEGSYAVTLSTDIGARTMVVTAKEVPSAPDSFFDVSTDPVDTGDATGMTACVEDYSTLNSCSNDGTCDVVIFWGDGTFSNIEGVTAGGGTAVACHTYNVPGTYTMGYSCEDSADNKSMGAPATLTVPTVGTGACTVSGTVSGVTPPYGTMLTLWDGASIVKRASTCSIEINGGICSIAATACNTAADCPATETCDADPSNQACPGGDGYYEIPNVQAGIAYDLVASRNGYTFTPDPDSFTLDCSGTPNNTGHDFTGTATW